MRAFLGHDAPLVQREAVRALARLAPGDIDAFVTALADPAPAGAKAAAGSLARRPSVVPLDTYVDVARNGAGDTNRRRAIELAWTHRDGLAPEVRVELTADATGTARRTALRLLTTWIKHVVPPPSLDHAGVGAAALAAIRRRADDLPEDLVRTAEHRLRA